MKIKSNSLIVKMIQNSFWFIEPHCVPKPTTSCGLFLSGVGSGLWHVAYTFFVSCFVTGAALCVAVLTGVSEGYNLSVLPDTMQIIIVMGFVIFFALMFIYLPAYIVYKLLKWLYDKGVFSKVGTTMKKMFTILTENPLTRKLSLLCKPIDYKGN